MMAGAANPAGLPAGNFRTVMDRHLADLIEAMWAGPLVEEQWERLTSLLAIRRRREAHERGNVILASMLAFAGQPPVKEQHDAMVDRLALLTSTSPGSAVQS